MSSPSGRGEPPAVRTCERTPPPSRRIRFPCSPPEARTALEEYADMDRFAVDGIPADPAVRTAVIDQIALHASCRSFDRGRPLPDGLVPVLAAAAQSASTSSNFQSWSVVQVTDSARKATLAGYCDDQAFIDQAPLFLVFCADTYRLRWLTRRQGYAFGSDYLELLMVSVVDSALACQNAALAAESLGLGCCMVGAIRNRPQDVAELLALPPGVFATIGLAVGYPARPPAVKPRLPQSVVLHREQYSTAGLEAGVAAYDERMARTSIYNGRRVPRPGLPPDAPPDSDPYSWAEHTARRMARGHEARRKLAGFLRRHGFGLD